MLAEGIRILNHKVEAGADKIIKLRSQKWNAIWEISRHLAHELNNLLAIISGATEVLLQSENLSQSVRLNLYDKIKRASQRVTKLGSTPRFFATSSHLGTNNLVDFRELA